MSFVGSSPLEMTRTASADHHSTPSAVVKVEWSPEHSCLSSVDDKAVLTNCTQLPTGNSTATCGSGTTKFDVSELTTHCRPKRADVVRGHGRDSSDKSSKIVASSSDTVSELNETIVPGDRKCSYSKAANDDGVMKGKHAVSSERLKSYNESYHNAVSCQSEKDCKLSAVAPGMDSKKRKFQTTAKTGIYVNFVN